MATENTTIETPKTSILDGLKPAEKPQESLTAQPAWHIMEGLPGNGERPDWLLDKYPTMADQAKAYKELEKKFGSREVAPDEYDFGENKSALDISNPVIQEFIGFAKQKNLSNEIVSTTVDKFVKYIKTNEPDINKEIEKLGPNGAERIETIRRWAENNLSANSLNVIGKITKSADAVEFLDELRQYQFHMQNQPPNNATAPSGFVKLTEQEVFNEMKQNIKRYENDSTYREEIGRKFAMAKGEF